MNRQEIEVEVIRVLTQIQRHSGQTNVIVQSDTCPLRDLALFDSLLALEASVELEEELGCPSEDNLFIDDRTNRPLRVAEVVDALCQRLRCQEMPNGQ
jgi:acyl carrier protein